MKYLLWCANEHVDFRVPEITAVAELYSFSISWIEESPDKPYVILELDDEKHAYQIASRSFMVKSLYELWGTGNDTSKLEDDVMEFMRQNDVIKYHNKPFKISIDTFGKSLTQGEKISKIENLSYLPLEGKFSMKNYELRLDLLEFYGHNPNEAPENPMVAFLGRHLADGQRYLLQKYSLKDRIFIGNTSMDPQLAFIMCNLALVDEAHFVFDPFVGTGSLLVAAAHFGAFVMGSDIDFLMLHGRTKPSRHSQKTRNDENIHANLRQYKLEGHYLDVCVADSSRPMWHPQLQFDAIITDPPYGIREPTERVGSAKQYKISSHHRPTHIPSKVEYSTLDLYDDLLKLAVLHLKVKGRIAYWIPVIRGDYSEEVLPSHPCLQVIYDCEQVLASHSARRLVVMEKTIEHLNYPAIGPGNSLDSEKINKFRQNYFDAVSRGSNQRFNKKEMNQYPGIRNKTGQYCG